MCHIVVLLLHCDAQILETYQRFCRQMGFLLCTGLTASGLQRVGITDRSARQFPWAGGGFDLRAVEGLRRQKCNLRVTLPFNTSS
jgi:hypothetical protein